MAQSPPLQTTDTMATELDPQQSPPTNSLKRRQSEVSEQENKRLRASPGKTSPDPEATRASDRRDRDAPSEERARRESTDKAAEAHPVPQESTRRKSSAINEKDRSRRLFGGLLGSLSQKGDSRTAKRRQEIESRRKAELQRQDDEHVEDKQRRLEQLAEKRRKVKKELEAETMRNRHRNMLHSAHFLHTSAQPRLLYKPWELRDEEEDCIDDQISEAKKQIERELASSESRPASRDGTSTGGSNERAIEETPQVDVATDASPAAVESSPALDATAHDKTTTASTSKDTTTADQNGADTAEHSSPKIGDNVTGEEETHDSAANNQDEHDDHVVEGEEDTVIY